MGRLNEKGRGWDRGRKVRGKEEEMKNPNSWHGNKIKAHWEVASV